ncbi:MAG: hypothetical protein LBE20_00655 [Deltaproteobacteria bacterium]|jgi:ribonuclease HI|nr:hypothetical protein [Deltaproteobacteria bacterium]
MLENKHYELYTDGGASEKGAASAVIISLPPQKRKVVCRLGKISAMEAEILAGILGVELITKNSEQPQVVWYCDNKVVVDIANVFLADWAANAWKNKQNKSIANLALWQEFWELTQQVKLEVRHVTAHSGQRQNTACDRACSWIQEKGSKLLEIHGEGLIGRQKNLDPKNAWLLLDLREGMELERIRQKIAGLDNLGFNGYI